MKAWCNNLYDTPLIGCHTAPAHGMRDGHSFILFGASHTLSASCSQDVVRKIEKTNTARNDRPVRDVTVSDCGTLEVSGAPLVIEKL